MKLALSTTLHTTFDDALARTRQALAEQGFGVLTEIDVTTTMKTELDVDMEDYVILGACNPSLAHRALDADRQIGLLLPCNVVVRIDASNETGRVVIEAMNPQLMVDLTELPGLQDVADEAADRLHKAVDSLIDR